MKFKLELGMVPSLKLVLAKLYLSFLKVLGVGTESISECMQVRD